jgi:hypothetical protein
MALGELNRRQARTPADRGTREIPIGTVTRSTPPRIPQLSVVIPCRNMEATIGAELDALASQSWSEPARVAERYAARLPHLRLVGSSAGAARAMPATSARRAAPALAFCDAADEAAAGWVAATGNVLAKHDFVACRLDTGTLNKARVRHPQEYALRQLWYPPYLPFSGTNGGVKRAVHDAVGGFDESLPRMTDTDYCVRIQLRGVPLVFLEDAVVHLRYHKGSGWTFRQARLWAEHNVLMYKRYRGDLRVRQPWTRYLLGWPRLLHRLASVRREEDLHVATGSWAGNSAFSWEVSSTGRLRYPE